MSPYNSLNNTAFQIGKQARYYKEQILSHLPEERTEVQGLEETHRTQYPLPLKKRGCRRWGLTPVIPATQEAEIRGIVVRSQPGK
jgi:hypothetical protein